MMFGTSATSIPINLKGNGVFYTQPTNPYKIYYSNEQPLKYIYILLFLFNVQYGAVCNAHSIIQYVQYLAHAKCGVAVCNSQTQNRVILYNVRISQKYDSQQRGHNQQKPDHLLLFVFDQLIIKKLLRKKTSEVEYDFLIFRK